MNHAELISEAKKTLRVSNEQISIWVQATPELLDKTLLFGFVEVDHDVAAEDDVISLRQELGLEIVEVEMNEFLDRFLDRVSVVHFVEVTKP